MSEPTRNSLQSRILCSDNVAWRKLQFIQHDEFKDFPVTEKEKLKKSLVTNEFIQPFYVWKDADEVIYCLDGKHRTLVLEELISEGVSVPEMLPALFIDCKDKADAAKMVLIFSSAYARVTEKGLADFISMHEIELPELLEQISIPALVIEDLMPAPDDLDSDAKEKPATLKLTFTDAAQLERAIPVIDELLKARFAGAFFSVSAGEI